MILVDSCVLIDVIEADAQAQVQGWWLLTRDTVRIRTCFPSVNLIAPE